MNKLEKYFYGKLKNSQPPVTEGDWLDFQQKLYQRRNRKRGFFWLYFLVGFCALIAVVLGVANYMNLNETKEFSHNQTLAKIEKNAPTHVNQIATDSSSKNLTIPDKPTPYKPSKKYLHKKNQYTKLQASKSIKSQSAANPIAKSVIPSTLPVQVSSTLSEEQNASKIEVASLVAIDTIPVSKVPTDSQQVKTMDTPKTMIAKRNSKLGFSVYGGIEIAAFYASKPESWADGAFISPFILLQKEMRKIQFSTGLGWGISSVTFTQKINRMISDSFPVLDTTGKILGWFPVNSRDTVYTRMRQGTQHALSIPFSIGYKVKINSKLDLVTRIGGITYIRTSNQLTGIDPVGKFPYTSSLPRISTLANLSVNLRYQYRKHWFAVFAPSYFQSVNKSKTKGGQLSIQIFYQF